MPPLPADNERKAFRGKRLQVPAAAWNKILDATKAYHRQKGREGAGGDDPDTLLPATTVLVKNTLSTDLAGSFHVLGVGDPVLTADADPGNLAERLTLAGSYPAAGSPFAVLQEPCAENEYARAAVSGYTLCYVLMNAPADGWADAIDTTDTHLGSQADCGAARIVWHGAGGTPPVEGAELAIVHLTGSCGGAPPSCDTPGGSYLTDDITIGDPPAGGAVSDWVSLAAIRLPAPGTYLVWAMAAGTAAVYGGRGTSFVQVRAYDCTAGVAVPAAGGDSGVNLVSAFPLGTSTDGPLVSGNATFLFRHTVDARAGGPTTIDFQTRNYAAAGPAFASTYAAVLRPGYAEVAGGGSCAGSGCAAGGSGSGSGGGGFGGGDGEEPFDLGDTVTATFSDGTGDCTCLDGFVATLPRSATAFLAWDDWEPSGATPDDFSACVSGYLTNMFFNWGATRWVFGTAHPSARLAGTTFVSQDEATKTVVLLADMSTFLGDDTGAVAPCTGTVVVTFQGS